ncbi:Chain length determinant protein [Bacteroides faecichinchillae]|uniref:Chain length determinant protein n=1 Tax=Bacteroides faecichinchillae TaxID=871325 RepID=A0A1M5GFX8_9BACE|nr:chain-length determining protein [Bacteroides faecichinchillae]THG59861.1 chain-length determining protein [Bacteroides faecichinchillae]SHG02645.1 Chain length determinant protein [Bacteroides faecichinchillae]
MTEQKLDKETPSVSNTSKADEMEIDLMDILRKIIGIRKTLYKAAGIGLIIGIIVALSIPKQYTVQVTLSPEMGNSKGNNGLAGLAASFLGSGATVGDGMDALNASLSSDIVSSTPFLLELLEINVPVSNKGENTTLTSYLDTQSSPWWSYVFGMPGMVIGGVKSLFTVDNEESTVDKMRSGTITLTKEEKEKIDALKKNISATVDNKTAMTSVSVVFQNPKVAAVVADSVVHKLQECITGYRTSKAKEDCIYLEKLFKERQDEYYTAQKKYATYVDTHDNLILQSVRAEQERLQNDMSLAYQVYSQVANQLQVARAKVQEEKPVFAIVEPAVVPQQPSGTGKKAYVILFVFLAVVVTSVWKLWAKDLLDKLKKELI